MRVGGVRFSRLCIEREIYNEIQKYLIVKSNSIKSKQDVKESCELSLFHSRYACV